jgi:hypothetical protein
MKNVKYTPPSKSETVYFVVPSGGASTEFFSDDAFGTVDLDLSETPNPRTLTAAHEVRPSVIEDPRGGAKIVARRGTADEIVMVTDDFQRAKPIHGSRVVLDALKGDWKPITSHWSLRRVQIKFRSDPNTEQWSGPVWLPLLRVHRPDNKGCKAVFSLATGKGSENEGSFEFAGLGGGGTVAFEETLSNSYGADKACKEVAVAATMEITFGWTYIDKTMISYGSRFAIVDLDEDKVRVQPVAPEMDSCNAPTGETKEHLLRKNPPGDTDAQTISREIEKKISGDVSIGLELGGKLMKIGAKFSRTTTEKWSLETTLQGGRDYVEYSPGENNPLEVCWALL